MEISKIYAFLVNDIFKENKKNQHDYNMSFLK